MNKIKIKKIAICALFTAVITACAWISVSTPFGVNLSFSLFGVCLVAFCLGVKGGIAATVTYILLGAAGLPVFSQFTGGIGVLFGASGGFVFGFLIVTVLCGIAKRSKTKAMRYLLAVTSVLICHTAGVLQFHFVTNNGIGASFLYASLPFLIKDILLVFLASFVSNKIKL